MFSLRKRQILPQNAKKGDKIDCQSPRAKLRIGKLGSPVLTGRHKQSDYLARAQKAQRALKHVNGVLLKPQRGAFCKSVQRKLYNVVFFKFRRHFLREVVFQGPYFVGQSQINRGAKDR